MDGQNNWDPAPPYGMDGRYDPDPGYARTAPSPGYDFNTVSSKPQGYDMPPMGYNQPTYVNDDGAKGLGTASMIIGIVSLVICVVGGLIFPFVCLLPLLSSIVGLVLGVSSLSKFRNTGATDGKGLAIAGVTTNAICLGLCIIGLLIILVAVAWIFEMGGIEEFIHWL